MKRVVIESPFHGKTKKETKKNIKYAQACLRDSLDKGEIPFASHLLYTQVLDDKIIFERNIGIEAGLMMTKNFDLTAVYTDLGPLTQGMQKGIEKSVQNDRTIEYRNLGKNWEKDYDKKIKSNPLKNLFKFL